MRKIKFRGKRLDNGEFIYGDLLTGGNEFAINNGTCWAMVEPESVAQLVGYDKDGREVYEGDTVILQNGTEYKAFLFDNIINGCKLKEAKT